MLVRDIMSRPVITIRGDETVADATRVLARTGLHHLVVTDRRDHVRGVIAAADLHDVPPQGRVEDFMSRHVYGIGPDASVEEAAALMRAHAIGSLPVLAWNRPIGIVTASDLLALVRVAPARM